MTRTRRVARSLLDRVFGGVCGGLGAYLGVSPWWPRLAFVVLTPLSGGVAGLLYLVLWWLLPPDLDPDAPQIGRDVGMLLLAGLTIAAAGGLTLARGLGVLEGPGGVDLFWPVVVLILGAGWLFRRMRNSQF